MLLGSDILPCILYTEPYGLLNKILFPTRGENLKTSSINVS